MDEPRALTSRSRPSSATAFPRNTQGDPGHRLLHVQDLPGRHSASASRTSSSSVNPYWEIMEVKTRRDRLPEDLPALARPPARPQGGRPQEVGPGGVRRLRPLPVDLRERLRQALPVARAVLAAPHRLTRRPRVNTARHPRPRRRSTKPTRDDSDERRKQGPEKRHMASSRAELLTIFQKTATEIDEKEFTSIPEATVISELGIDSLGMLEIVGLDGARAQGADPGRGARRHPDGEGPRGAVEKKRPRRRRRSSRRPEGDDVGSGDPMEQLGPAWTTLRRRRRGPPGAPVRHVHDVLRQGGAGAALEPVPRRPVREDPEQGR